MLTAFGPFVTDMYLPSLPSMGEYFGATSSQVQLGLTTSMIGLAMGQVLLPLRQAASAGGGHVALSGIGGYVFILGLLEFGVMGIANGILTIYTPYV